MKYVNFCLGTILTLVLTSGSVKQTTPSVGYYPGETIPDIVLTGLNGDQVRLNEYKGRKVVVNFWASYDAQSRATNVKLYNYIKMNDIDVSFVSISLDENSNVAKRTWTMDNLETISQFCEIEGSASALYRDFKLNRGFRSYLIDEEGVIVAMNITPEDLGILL
jgi:peroxiredoxin